MNRKILISILFLSNYLLGCVHTGEEIKKQSVFIDWFIGQSNSVGIADTCDLPIGLKTFKSDSVMIMYNGTFSNYEVGVNHIGHIIINKGVDFLSKHGSVISYVYNASQVKEKRYIIKVGGIGRSLFLLDNDYDFNVASKDEGWTAIKSCYDTLKILLPDSVYSYHHTIFWNQWEGDGYKKIRAEKYFTNFKSLHDSITDVFRGEIQLNVIRANSGAKKYGYLRTIQETQDKIGDVFNCAIINTDSFSLGEDLTHYTSKGYIDLGNEEFKYRLTK